MGRTKRKKVNVVTLGCSKNLVDSEQLMRQLQSNDFDIIHDSEDVSDIVIINTCGFIDNAKQESIDTILGFSDMKRNGMIEKLIVTGCLSERFASELKEEIRDVDAWFGTSDLPNLLGHLNIGYKSELLGERLLTTPSHFAYLKISEGCNRTCAFCAIPLMRGQLSSKPIEILVGEAKKLASGGTKEIILIAQELTYYGLDIYKKRMLATLLEKLSALEGIEWIRLHYAYPNQFPLDILPVIREHPNICHYLDIPFQHASDAVLNRMKRQATRKEQESLISLIRKEVPGIALRTTMLVGFPGETEAEFQELLDFIAEIRFDRLGVFMYSHEEGTSAYKLEDDVPHAIKEERAARLMALQQEISFEKNSALIGQALKVLIDRVEGDYFIGRSEFDSPEVDNEILIPVQDTYLRVGDFCKAEITDVSDFDLFAKVIKM